MEKLKFKFVVKAGEDPKTSIICTTTNYERQQQDLSTAGSATTGKIA